MVDEMDDYYAFIVRGYHGTSESAANAILREGFRPTQGDDAWLGQGVYFFESDPAQARGWAMRQHEAEPAVLEASLALNEPGLDLLRLESRSLFQELATEMIRADPEGFRSNAFCDGTVIEYVKTVSQVRWVRALVLVGGKEYATRSTGGLPLKTIGLPRNVPVRTIRNAIVVISVTDLAVIRCTRRFPCLT